MKGIVFTEFLAMVEARSGFDVVDSMIERSGVPNKGAYAATGTYPCQELMAMVGALSAMTNTSVPDLIRNYGKHLFSRLAAAFPQYVPRDPGLFPFLQSIDGHIHVEVRRIYPDAELPSFTSRVSSGGECVELEYRSPRRLDALALGLLEGAVEHFAEGVSIHQEALAGEPGTRFLNRRLRKVA